MRRFDRHVLAAEAIAAGGASDELPVLVDERDRRAVDLRLHHVGDRLIRVEPLADVVGPLLNRLVGRHLLERAHRRQVLDLLELVRGRPAHPPCRRVVGRELRLLLLERLQLVEEAVVLGVRRPPGRRARGSGSCGDGAVPGAARPACAASQRAARSSSADATTASGSSASSRSRGWMPPQVTAIECMPAPLAARMSKGESPT